MADVITKLENLINPEVMADMVSAKLEKAIRVLPYAAVDTTLQGNAGDTISVPVFNYIGDAVDVAEGEEIPTRTLSATAKSYTIKKAGIGGILTDEAMLSGYGNPVGELNTQMANSIAAKCDEDAMTELFKASTAFVAADIISYDTVIDALDVFEEEDNTEKAIFVHPKQVTQLRKDPDFIAKDKYGNQVMIDGEIGMIANTHIVPTKKAKYFATYYTFNESGTLTVVASGGNDSSTVDLSKVLPSCPSAKVDDKVNLVSTPAYFNPIVKLEPEEETEDERPALTYFIKRDTNIETERVAKKRLTEVTGDQMYTVALTNDAKVVILKAKATPSV